tara:strand:- start:562 stop:3930 length:3369 start_codon:yes stop_codon:yes gene_type:complete
MIPYTILKSNYHAGKLIKNGETTNRYYQDKDTGEEKLQPPVKWFKKWTEPHLEQPILPQLASTIEYIEDKNINALLVTETLKEEYTEAWVRLTEEYWQQYPKYLIQIEIDEVEQSVSISDPLNKLSIQERVTIARDWLPFLDNVGMVAHLSNKAFFPAYPNHLSLRMYVELASPLYLPKIKELLEPWAEYVDTKIYSQRRRHYVQPPEVIGNPQRNIPGKSVHYIPGKKLELLDLEKTERYKQYQHTKATRKSTNRLIAGTDDTALSENLDTLAADGYFNGRRNSELFRLIAEEIWKKQDATRMKDLIEANPDIIGPDRSRKPGEETNKHLEDMEAGAHTSNRQKLSIGQKYKWDVELEDPKALYLKQENLEELWQILQHNLEREIKTFIIIKSGHATAKTTGAILPTMNLVNQHFQGKRKILYISTEISLIRQQCKNLGIQCYLDDEDVALPNMGSIKKLGICIFSIHKLQGAETPGLGIIDEINNAMLWADFQDKQNTNHEQLISDCSKIPVILGMDADVGALTHQFAKKVQEKGGHQLVYLENTSNHIETQNLTMIDSPSKAHAQTLDLLHQDKTIWMHTDIADGIYHGNHTSLAKMYNTQMGKEIAYVINRQMPKADRIRIQVNPDKEIARLYNKGYRLFISSPIIRSGWRYNGKYPFTATVGIYDCSRPFITAEGQVQAMQRVFGVKDNYMYVNPQCSYVDRNYQERVYQEYSRESIAKHLVGDTDDIRQVIEDINNELPKHGRLGTNWSEIEIRALAKAQKANQLSNVKLDLLYQWLSWNGPTPKLLEKEFDQETLDLINGTIKENKTLQREEIAKQLLSNSEHRNGLLERYICLRKNSPLFVPGRTDQEPELDELLEIISMQERLPHYGHDASLFINMLAIPRDKREETLSHWSLWGAPSQNYNPIDIHKSHYKQQGYYRQIGKMFYPLSDRVEQDNNRKILDFLLEPGGKPLLIETQNYIGIKDYEDIKMRYRTDMKDHISFFNLNMKSTTFLKDLFKHCFNCTIKYESISGTSVKDAKRSLIQHYKNLGTIKQSITDKEALLIIMGKIKNKIINDYSLDEIETEYLEATNKIMQIENSTIQPQALYQELMKVKDTKLSMDEIYDSEIFETKAW